MYIVLVDENGKIIGVDVVSEGVICYDKKLLYFCGGMIDVKYVIIIEVYFDSDNVIFENCNDV